MSMPKCRYGFNTNLLGDLSGGAAVTDKPRTVMVYNLRDFNRIKSLQL